MRLPTKHQAIQLLIFFAAPAAVILIDYMIRQRTLPPNINLLLAFTAFATIIFYTGTLFHQYLEELSWRQLFFRVFTLWLFFVSARGFLTASIATDMGFWQILEVGIIGEVQGRYDKIYFLFRGHCIGIFIATIACILYDPKDYDGPSWNISLFCLWLMIIAIFIFT